MARFVVKREQSIHEEWTILSIELLPLCEVIFANIREVSLEFLVQHKRVQIRDIQKTHLGQALVQFVHIYDRDRLISQSPHAYGDVFFSFTKHNEGRNWRQIEYNREIWLLLLGFLMDYLSRENLQHAITSFGKLLTWEEEKSNRNRLLVKARVTDLEDVPKHIVMSENVGFQGETWSIQCEIIHQNLLDAQPPDEDPAPNDDQMDMHEPPFDFFLFRLASLLGSLPASPGLSPRTTIESERLGSLDPRRGQCSSGNQFKL
jgi:hypothetical protein